jgi:CheY-like chemotaxis protein
MITGIGTPRIQRRRARPIDVFPKRPCDSALAPIQRSTRSEVPRRREVADPIAWNVQPPPEDGRTSRRDYPADFETLRRIRKRSFLDLRSQILSHRRPITTASPRCEGTLLAPALSISLLPRPLTTSNRKRGHHGDQGQTDDPHRRRRTFRPDAPFGVLRGARLCGLSAGDARSALILLETRAISLLLADVGLPGLSGRDLAAAARKLHPSLPVLFVTGYSDQHEQLSRNMAQGMAVLAKPFDMERLADIVRAMTISHPAETAR